MAARKGGRATLDRAAEVNARVAWVAFKVSGPVRKAIMTAYRAGFEAGRIQGMREAREIVREVTKGVRK